jgi:hypothetical protein
MSFFVFEAVTIRASGNCFLYLALANTASHVML